MDVHGRLTDPWQHSTAQHILRMYVEIIPEGGGFNQHSDIERTKPCLLLPTFIEVDTSAGILLMASGVLRGSSGVPPG